MKHYRYFISLLGAITLMTACDFLDVVPDDAPTIEDAFKNRAAAEKALFTSKPSQTLTVKYVNAVALFIPSSSKGTKIEVLGAEREPVSVKAS